MVLPSGLMAELHTLLSEIFALDVFSIIKSAETGTENNDIKKIYMNICNTFIKPIMLYIYLP
jgi:hypothetical protein